MTPREICRYYFRTEFNFSDDPVGSEIDISAVIDDGARFWLNGIEIDRVRLPNGVIEHGTGASSNTAARDENNLGMSEPLMELVNLSPAKTSLLLTFTIEQLGVPIIFLLQN